MLLNPFFNFIFFLICQSSLHRFTKFGTEVGSKAFNFGIYLSISSLFVIICQGHQRWNSWIWNSDGTISQIWQQPKWDTTTVDSGIYWASKNLSPTKYKKGNDWNKCIKMQQYECCQRLIYNKLKYNQSPEAALEVWHPWSQLAQP